VSDVPSASIPLTVTTAESVIPLTLDIVQHETVTVEVLPKPKNPSSATTFVSFSFLTHTRVLSSLFISS